MVLHFQTIAIWNVKYRSHPSPSQNQWFAGYPHQLSWDNFGQSSGWISGIQYDPPWSSSPSTNKEDHPTVIRSASWSQVLVAVLLCPGLNLLCRLLLLQILRGNRGWIGRWSGFPLDAESIGGSGKIIHLPMIFTLKAVSARVACL